MSNTASAPSSVQPTLIVVLGMHRSGTSVLTRAMETLGADLGSSLMPPAAGNNDKGFFEDIDINRINIEVMHTAGYDWDSMTSIDLSSIDSHRLDELRVKAASILRAKCSGRIFALKDPRIARLSAFWQPIFAALQSRVVYAIAVRNPISVAHSLSKRDGFADEKSHILWLAHTVDALEATTGSTRTLVSYDTLLNAPRQELKRISSELELPVIESRIDAFEQEFLDEDLRHTRFLAEDLELLHSLPRQVKTLFASLDESVRNRLPLNNPALIKALESARAYLDDTAPLLRYEWQLDRQLRAAQAIAHANEEALRHRTHELETLNLRLTSVNEAIRASQQQQSTLSEALHHASLERNDARLERDSAYLERDKACLERDDARRERDDARRERDDARQALATAELSISRMKNDLDQIHQSLTDILASTSWYVTAPLRVVGRLVKRR
ncbi:sulfotransferase family protein [Burkholderia multivorans]|uniref:sulfotransferase family protein n=1 Tax=Burkholderia multivorans TaxID=87883 RepID=UPI001C230D29|nr:hypothetical protein [Burkholderia multivorans]MBU9411741.1 hypothetical protein [Burkholderia multivorans]UXZ83204.1 hypothetical protein NUJ31_04040 [Burkholderia multivorans]